MPILDWVSALIVVVLWGLNFVAIKLALVDLPPFLLGATRFTVLLFPALLFIKRPKIPFKILFLYGITISFGQFAFLFTGMHLGMPAGLASLVLQAQAFFSVLIAAIVLREPIKAHSIIAIFIALFGLFIIDGAGTQSAIPIMALLATLGAAFCWAMGNITIKFAKNVDMLSLVVWGSTIPIIPFLIASYFIEGPDTIISSIKNIHLHTIFALFYLAYAATLTGYGLWGKLMAKHSVSLIAPLSLLVPLVGLVSSSYLLNERLSPIQWIGGAIVLLGLLVNVFGPKIIKRLGLVKSRP